MTTVAMVTTTPSHWPLPSILRFPWRASLASVLQCAGAGLSRAVSEVSQSRRRRESRLQTLRKQAVEAVMADSPCAEIREKFQAALALSRVELHRNPEKEPYKSKYSARALLEEVKALLGPAPEDEDERPPTDDSFGAGDHTLGLPAELVAAEGPVARGSVRRAVIEFHLGVNHIDTEELSAGEEHLVKCLRLLRKYRLSQDCVSLYIQAQIGSPPLDPTEHFLPEEEKLAEQERSKRFEKVYTHNLYYLAQVYQHMEMFEKAAHYCHSTLKRQLEHNAYHPMEWAINAATLSQFYINKQCFMEARHCLSAANVIFGQTGKIRTTEDTTEAEGDVPELYHQRKGEIARCWIKYCLTLMQNAQLSMQDNIGELDPDKQSELRALRKKELDEEESIRKKAVQFGTGELCDAISAVEEKVSSLRPLDFEEARELFLMGQHYVFEAKEFFQIDGYVTDHIEIVQDHSALFKVLAFFETDMERRCKMHKRRIAMLEPLTVDLNPQYYLLVNRQIQFEIAHAYYDMMDLKVAIADKLRDPDSHIVKKINSLNKSALKYYQLFLDSLRDPNKVFPEHIGEDVLRPAMLAKFRVARLYGKIITADPKKELENLATSLEHYKFIVDYCEKHPEAAQEIEVELELSKEMVSLLPTKMERFRTKMALT
ncbi:KIF-binding protein isoform X1 [Hippopotamus amphibius kiboko]|uniref:KIF-binding protein isoform X1 n=1 Tax=Hippopotamus amphibius kiboko TaxID=575201 RepID=UPI0025972E5D|nr:KIF-binding protein isoform X1 [Hippopotamus amphibius kiboko]